jgi:hypothetical protein
MEKTCESDRGSEDNVGKPDRGNHGWLGSSM